MKRIGIMTTGGDCSGMNTVINRVVLGEPDKIINMLENFIDTAVHNGGKVVVFVDPSCKYKFKYPKADE